MWHEQISKIKLNHKPHKCQNVISNLTQLKDYSVKHNDIFLDYMFVHKLFPSI